MRHLTILFLTVYAVANPAFAAEGHDHDHGAHSGEGFFADVHAKVHSDQLVSVEAGEHKFSETYAHAHFDAGASFGEHFSVFAGIKLEGEPAGHAHGGEVPLAVPDGSDRFFDDHPLIVEQLKLTISDGPFSLYGGKFNPKVGFNYERFPGVYSYQTVEEYAIKERIGVGFGVSFNAIDYGVHKLDFSTFHADTSALSDSLITKRGQTDKEDGGVSNTEDISSFAISLGGSDFYSLNNDIVEGLSYQLGYAEQKAGRGNEADEKRTSAGLEYRHQFSRDLEARLVTEIMDIDHINGEAAHDRTHSMLALGWDYRRWNFTVSYMNVDNMVEEEHDEEEEEEGHHDEDEDEHEEDEEGHGHEHDHEAEGMDGHIFQVSLGYQFNNGIGLDWGYQYVDEEGEITERMGLMLSFGYAF